MSTSTLTKPTVDTQARERPIQFALYLLLGVLFGIVLIKSEVVSWFRIQEMFRFQSFHMYGIMGSALAVAGVSIRLIKKYEVRAMGSRSIHLPPKKWGTGTRYWLGGIFFGIGWAFTGACPGPIFALIGSGLPVFLVVLLAALVGTWAYAHLRPRLPH